MPPPLTCRFCQQYRYSCNPQRITRGAHSGLYACTNCLRQNRPCSLSGTNSLTLHALDQTSRNSWTQIDCRNQAPGTFHDIPRAPRLHRAAGTRWTASPVIDLTGGSSRATSEFDPRPTNTPPPPPYHELTPPMPTAPPEEPSTPPPREEPSPAPPMAPSTSVLGKRRAERASSSERESNRPRVARPQLMTPSLDEIRSLVLYDPSKTGHFENPPGEPLVTLERKVLVEHSNAQFALLSSFFQSLPATNEEIPTRILLFTRLFELRDGFFAKHVDRDAE